MTHSSVPEEQSCDDHNGSVTDFELDIGVSMSAGPTTHDFMSDEKQLPISSSTPDLGNSDSQDSSRHSLIVAPTISSRNTFFFLDHTGRLAVTHYQKGPKPTTAVETDAPQFVLQIYILSNESMFGTRDALKTTISWCEKLLLLPATTHLLHELGLTGTSVRFEMYDGLANFEAIIVHSRNEREHRHMYIEYLDCEEEMRLAHVNVQHGNLALHPAVHPRVGSRLQRAKQLQKSIRDYEAAKRHPNAWNRPANVMTQEQATALTGSQLSGGPSSQSAFSVPPSPPSSHTILTRQMPAPSSVQDIAPALPHVDIQGPASEPATARRPPGASIFSPLPSTTGLPTSASNLPATRIAKPGSPLNPFVRSANPINPASFFLAPHQLYHHAVIVVDEFAWQRRGLVVLKFDKERDWAESADVDDLDGGFVAERVSCYADGRVEQRAREKNTPEEKKPLRMGELELEPQMELVSKRWLGEVLVETVKGGYFAHLAQ